MIGRLEANPSSVPGPVRGTTKVHLTTKPVLQDGPTIVVEKAGPGGRSIAVRDGTDTGVQAWVVDREGASIARSNPSALVHCADRRRAGNGSGTIHGRLLGETEIDSADSIECDRGGTIETFHTDSRKARISG
jgi:hypothetical protein